MSKNKINVRDCLDGDEVDLSYQGLTAATLPLKELANLKKGKKLDLSKNQIVRLPDTFVTSMGVHLVKLDLSGNGLMDIPLNFGNMALLQHLDLFNNKLTALPVSVFKLKLLRWLDLKENPLEYPPSEVVGLCRNDAECKTCATQVIQFMKKENTDQESQRQKQLEAKRAKKESLKKELERLEELENMERRRIKQEEKSRDKAKRRAEYEEKMKNQPSVEKKTPEASVPKSKPSVPKASGSGPSLAMTTVVSCVLLLLVAGVTTALLKPDLKQHYDLLKDLTEESLLVVADSCTPIIASLNSQLKSTAPGLERSLTSASQLLGEMLVICGDTLTLGYELAHQELAAFSIFVQKLSVQIQKAVS